MWHRDVMRKLLLSCALLSIACGGTAAAPDGGRDGSIAMQPDAGPPPPYVPDDRWHRQVVFYELWVRSFQDSDGDGIGDLPGLTSRLDYLADLGVGGLWLMPTYPSPLADSGYDVADYVGVHPDYGTLDDLDTFLAEAHARGIHVYLDLVFNHTSREHPWFVDSQANPTGEHGDWFVWADEPGLNCDGAGGPFGDQRWSLDDVRGQYYFHQFYPAQPDLDFDEPAMRAALLDVMRFWLDRGVDGFRLDVPYRYVEELPMCTHLPGTYDFLRQMRGVTDAYDDRSMVGEVLADAPTLATYVESDVLQMVFMLGNAFTYWSAGQSHSGTGLGNMMDDMVAAMPEGGGTFATLIGNHDLPRATDAVHEEAALKMMAAAQLTFPGVPFVYYGEELGMQPGTDFIVDSRDSARTPMQWDATASAGFTTGTPFLALAPEHETRNVEAMSGDEGSMLAFYRRLIHLRNDTPALRTGTYQRVLGTGARVLAFWRRHPDGDRLVVVHFGTAATDLTIAVPNSFSGTLHDDLSDADVGTARSGTLTATIPPETAWVLRPAG